MVNQVKLKFKERNINIKIKKYKCVRIKNKK